MRLLLNLGWFGRKRRTSKASPKVLIDTSALKGAAARLPRYFGNEETIQFGPHKQTLMVYSEGTLLPNLALDLPQQAETEALRDVDNPARECLEAEYFLTLDRKLARLLATHRKYPLPKVQIVMLLPVPNRD